MNENIVKILEIWHKHFQDEENQYTEFEASDIEYFIGCMLYTKFAFSHALDTMKTIDLSYDFLENCGQDEYAEIEKIISSIEISDEKEKIDFLQNFIKESKEKYTQDELYLLDRLEYHVEALADRYEKDIKAKQVVFQKPTKSKNPLL
ncbi:MAG: hypothetical protein U9N02_04495 [Campylobacterota bacterium]|nr:hypothetical protein [Campylobacterota bacterium]